MERVFGKWFRPVFVARLAMQLATAMVLILLVAHGAMAQKINVEFDQSVDFSKYKTFTIRKGTLNSRNAALNSELVKKQIDADIEKALTKKGLTEVSDNADLNVVYRLGSARRTELEAYPAGWRGIAREEKSDPNKIQGKLDDMVKKSFDKYPPKVK